MSKRNKTVQSTFGIVEVEAYHGKMGCQKRLRFEQGNAVICGNSADYVIRNGRREYRCSMHTRDCWTEVGE